MSLRDVPMNADRSKAPVSVSQASAAKVLVTDDDPTSRLLIKAALEGNVGEVTEAENGLLALSKLAAHRFDLAIVDLDMPVMDGFGFIERARALPDTRQLPIIVVTARDDVVAIERAYALGATSFLCKPLNWNVFRYQVAFVLQSARVEKDRRSEARQSELRAIFHQRGLSSLKKHLQSVLECVHEIREAKPEEISSGLMARIDTTGTAATRLVARLERISSLLARPLQLTAKTAQADQLLTSALTRVAAELGDAEIARVSIDIQATADVICDRELAVEALSEIILNALMFSPPGASVLVRVVGATGDRVRYEIKDHGTGIPHHLLDRDLEGFKASSQRDTGGLGLGLLLAKDLVERHGGHFGIMSERDKGTEVFLSFPIRSAAAGEQAPELRLASA